MRFPDYDHSILSIPATILRHYGEEASYPSLPALDDALSQAPTRTIILVLLDGMGEHLLRRRLKPDAFLVKHDTAALSTVYPSTTTAATTSIWTGQSPLEHGWIGWSLYFKECGRQIEAFMDRDGFSHERYPFCSPAETFMPLTSIYKTLRGKTQTHTLYSFASYSAKEADCAHTVLDFPDMARVIKDLAHEPGEKMIYAYCPEPDRGMHATGVHSQHTCEMFESLNARVENLASALPKDALLIVTADHGLVDVTENIFVNEIPALDDCLYMPPSVEARAASFFVKPHRKAAFEREFKALAGEDFLLIPHDEVFSMGLLGRGNAHRKVDDFIGDYLACALGSRAFIYNTPANKVPKLIGQHAGLTDDEMTVPLILYRGNA